MLVAGLAMQFRERNLSMKALLNPLLGCLHALLRHDANSRAWMGARGLRCLVGVIRHRHDGL